MQVRYYINICELAKTILRREHEKNILIRLTVPLDKLKNLTHTCGDASEMKSL